MTRRRKTGDFVDLFGLLKRRLLAVTTEAYAAIGLARMQGRLVRQIGQHSPISQAELARGTDMDPALAGRVLQGLIEAGLVRRQRSAEDRREYILTLTAAGRRAEARVEKARTQLAERLAAILDDRDVEDFERIVKKVLTAFD